MNQTNTGIVSKATLENVLRDGVEDMWAFPRTQILSETDSRPNRRIGPEQKDEPCYIIPPILCVLLDSRCWFA